MGPRQRAASRRSAAKPAPNAGLTVFVASGAIESLWLMLVLAEKAVDTIRVEWIRPDQPHEDFRILNPDGSLPALADREGIFRGARIIAEYLNERYPHPPLMPPSPALRAQVRMRVEHLVMEVFPQVETLKPGARLPARIQDAVVDAFREYQQDSRSRDTRSAAVDYSLADCAWTALFLSLQRKNIALPAKARGLRAWAEALLRRPTVEGVELQ